MEQMLGINQVHKKKQEEGQGIEGNEKQELQKLLDKKKQLQSLLKIVEGMQEENNKEQDTKEQGKDEGQKVEENYHEELDSGRAVVNNSPLDNEVNIRQYGVGDIITGNLENGQDAIDLAEEQHSGFEDIKFAQKFRAWEYKTDILDPEKAKEKAAQKRWQKLQDWKNHPFKNIWNLSSKMIKSGAVYAKNYLGYAEWFFRYDKDPWANNGGEENVFKKVHEKVQKNLKEDLDYRKKVEGIKKQHNNVLKWLKLEQERLNLKMRKGYPTNATDKEIKAWRSKINADFNKWKRVYFNEINGWKKYQKKDFNSLEESWMKGKFRMKDWSKEEQMLKRNSWINGEKIDDLEAEVQDLRRSV